MALLRAIGVDTSTDTTEEAARRQLQGFSMDPKYGPLACELVRSRALQFGVRPPFPFSTWLKEQEVNGTTAEDVMRLLHLQPPSKGASTSEADYWMSLRKLSASDAAWEMIGQMASMVIEEPAQKVNTVSKRTEDVARWIAQSRQIIILTGAGISASCGIPTFRDEGGFYAKVAQEFGLASPQELNDISFFRRDPGPWFTQVRPFLPVKSKPFKPSLTHRFIRMLEDRGKLLHLFTQNIDSLEQAAGITRVTYCHGSFATATCMACGKGQSGEEVNEVIARSQIPRCAVCEGVMKPDVVLFNEPMPVGVNDRILEHVEQADLLLVAGTSLNVTPCSLIPHLVGVSGDVPRVLINMEPAGKDGDFDAFLQGPCDEIIGKILQHLGWNLEA